MDLAIKNDASNLKFNREIDKILYLSGVYDLKIKDQSMHKNDLLRNHFDLNVARPIEELHGCMNSFKNLKRVVFASSQAVDISFKIVASKNASVENLAYGLNKHLAEKVCSYFLNNIPIKFYPLRIGTVYGAGEPAHRFAFQLLKHFSENKPFLVKNSSNRRNYLYVMDIAKFIFKILETESLETNKPIYLAGKEIFTVKEYSENLQKAWEKHTGKKTYVDYMNNSINNDFGLMECDSNLTYDIPDTPMSEVSEKLVNWFINGSPDFISSYL
jgi:nucleoside-diphosphate-sugar epimerase